MKLKKIFLVIILIILPYKLYAKSIENYPFIITISDTTVFLTNIENKIIKPLTSFTDGWVIKNFSYKANNVVLLIFKKISAKDIADEKYFSKVLFFKINDRPILQPVLDIKSVYGESYEIISSIELSPSGNYLLVKNQHWESESASLIELKTKSVLFSAEGFLGWNIDEDRETGGDRAFMFNYESDMGFGYEDDISGTTIIYDYFLNNKNYSSVKIPIFYPIAFNWSKRFIVGKVPKEKIKVYNIYDEKLKWK